MLLRVQHNGLCGKQSSRHGTAELPDTREKQPSNTATSSGPFCSPQLLKFTPTAQVHPTCLSSPHLPEFTPLARVYPHLAEYIPCAGQVHPICLSSPHLSECLPPVRVHPHLSEYLPPAQVHPTRPSISHLSEFTLPV